MDYIELKFIRLVSGYLPGFREVREDLWNCRCPACGDSRKSKSKQRGYLFIREGRAFFMCHNCSWSTNLYGLLKEVAPSLCQSYTIERFGERRVKTQVPLAKSTEMARRLIKDEIFTKASRLSDLPEDHPSRVYIENRMIPSHWLFDLFHVDDIKDFSKMLPDYEDRRFPDSPAILIPFYDADMSIMYVTARLLEGDLRYVTFEVQGGKKIWGLHQIDWTKTVYVCEGQFDAMFIDNCVAVAGSSILQELKYLQDRAKAGIVLIFDRDYTTNGEIYSNLRKAIEGGVPVVLYDAKFKAKDINDAVLAGLPRDSLMTYIKSRTFSGLSARLEFGRIHPPRVGTYGKAKKASSASKTSCAW